MRLGFRLDHPQNLVERPPSGQEIDRRNDTYMVNKKSKSLTGRSEQVLKFIKSKKDRQRESIKKHNMKLVDVGAEDLDDLDDQDMETDVVDKRIEKQIERMINEDLFKIKKGSLQY